MTQHLIHHKSLASCLVPVCPHVDDEVVHEGQVVHRQHTTAHTLVRLGRKATHPHTPTRQAHTLPLLPLLLLTSKKQMALGSTRGLSRLRGSSSPARRNAKYTPPQPRPTTDSRQDSPPSSRPRRSMDEEEEEGGAPS